ncbi:MAG: pantoate--beta-alanine ligase [Bifidobacteriaceae bacterium]|nr:pantoate--beta-alanine ligase [Bifidobacteriaceae bacterium]
MDRTHLGAAPGAPLPPVARSAAELAAIVGEPNAWAGGPASGTVKASDDAPSAPRRAVVMTMGALHEGHLDLVREAVRRAGQVIVTIFVNPLQFGPAEDFDAYPRDLARDLAALAPFRVAAVYAPTVSDVYPDGDAQVRIDPGPMGRVFEGAIRPGHFAGALTVIAKLLARTRPDIALFGRKDAQQLALVQRMVKDLDLGVEIVPVPIRREADGLAMSSRNRYLSEKQRAQALALPHAIEAGKAAAQAGAGSVEVEAQARAALGPMEPGMSLDYMSVVDPESFVPLDAAAAGRALLIGALRVGSTRLIDNAELTLA